MKISLISTSHQQNSESSRVRKIFEKQIIKQKYRVVPKQRSFRMDQGEQQQQRATPVRPDAPGHSAERTVTPGRRLGAATDRLSRDAPLVEHLRRCGAKNPEQSAEKLVKKIDKDHDGAVTLNVTTATFWNVPFYLILNTALGGGWPGSVNASTILPARHRIDYVRVSRPVA